MKDDEYTKEKLESNPLLRHMFNKIGKSVVVVMDGYKIQGLFVTLDVCTNYMEMQSPDATHFINLKKLHQVITPNSVEARARGHK